MLKIKVGKSSSAAHNPQSMWYGSNSDKSNLYKLNQKSKAQRQVICEFLFFMYFKSGLCNLEEIICHNIYFLNLNAQLSYC